MARSNSSLANVNTHQKWREAFTFLRWRLSGSNDPSAFDELIRQVQGYGSTYEQFTGRPFTDARVLEIGFGARPFHLIALMSMGINVRGIDLDMPMLRFNPVQLGRILMENGLERALKTSVRNLLFDRRDQAKLGVALERHGSKLHIDRTRFLVGDAATYDYGTDPVDLVYSEDVFEHIPHEGLQKLVARLAAQLSPQGIALVTPNIFTGITGGHLPEWYTHLVNEDIPRKSEPWEHLRKKRHTANTYLNGLPRSAYRELFSRHFEILEEKTLQPELGRRWLTPETKPELAEWSDEELFSNKIQFILRRKTNVQS